MALISHEMLDAQETSTEDEEVEITFSVGDDQTQRLLAESLAKAPGDRRARISLVLPPPKRTLNGSFFVSRLAEQARRDSVANPATIEKLL